MKKSTLLFACILAIICLSGCARSDNDVSGQPSAVSIPVVEEDMEAKMQDTVPETEEPVSDEYKIIMVGDVLLHTPIEENCRQADGSYDYSSLFAHTKDEIASADLALVNQEVIIGGAELGISGYPCFNADYSLSDALVDAGFDVICHATNHAMDKGRAGLLNCA